MAARASTSAATTGKRTAAGQAPPRGSGAGMAAPRLKRVYAEAEAADGIRILVDRLWPRGIAKEKARIDLKDLAPSHALRKRFHGKPEDWDAFRAAYAAELTAPAAQAAVAALRAEARKGPVTLLYAARDETRNNAVALQRWLAKNN